ncbi:MAG: peptide-N-glycosidase F-related protein [Flavobacteriales bacterium]|jgi:hypothetical protein|nr:peptide-N-glycosidase F-related protein [Flavobacteriales bacterium]
MKKLLPIFFLLGILSSFAQTTVVMSHDSTHMKWYKKYIDTTSFPTNNTTYSKIMMELVLSCPDGGCSQWDYTTKILLEEPTGKMDSTLKSHPNFKVDGNSPDTFNYTPDQVYTYTVENDGGVLDTLSIDTIAQMDLVLYSDSLNPTTSTGTQFVYPTNIYNYTVDTNGQITDSTLVSVSNATQIIKKLNYYYKVFEVKLEYELGRIITPYAGGLTASWGRRYEFEVTDLAPLLKGDKVIKLFYQGWSDGFTGTLKFHFTQGTPPRDVKDIHHFWSGGHDYGKWENGVHTIENYMNQKKFYAGSDVKYSVLNFIPTGHGFGGNNNPENCAEFCDKWFKVLSNGNQVAQHIIWKNDCGSNAHYPQGGTWWYDRANWCPGEAVPEFDIDLNVQSNDTNTFDINFQEYTGNGGSYNISGYVVNYGEYNSMKDAAVSDILAPSKKYDHKRFNPICGAPKIKVQNRGKETITSLKIKYGITGQVDKEFVFNGNISSMKFMDITLPSLDFSNYSQSINNTFYAEITEVNGGTDQNTYDNKLTTDFEAVDKVSEKIIINFRTNNFPNESSYKIYDANNNVVLHQNGALSANTTYKDTFVLLQGCYRFEFEDSQGNGLRTGFQQIDSQYGTGWLKFKKAGAGSKTFNSNFGNKIVYYFVTDPSIGTEEIALHNDFDISPNPSQGNLLLSNLDIEGKTTIRAFNNLGQEVYSNTITELSSEHNIDLSKLPNGHYTLSIETAKDLLTQKFTIQK